MASLTPISGTLGIERAAHLLRRCTFGPSVNSIQSFAFLEVQDAIDQLFQSEQEHLYPVEPLSGEDWIYPNSPHPDVMPRRFSEFTSAWWLENTRLSGDLLTERMTWFYYTHIPIIISRTQSKPQFAVDYVRLLRHYALGNYKALIKAICIDNAMLVHLDGNLNIKSVPQENFARELLELFVVGKGKEAGVGDYTTFTEQDVVMATKVLTGWGIDDTFQTIDSETGIPTGKVKSNGNTSTQHDVSTKEFSYAFNNTVITTNDASGGNTTVQAVYDELDDFIEMLFESPHTAINICKRIYRQFVYFNITPEIEEDIIEPLADILRNNDYEITSVLEVLLKSEHFYDADNTITEDDNRGAIIKSPMDLTIGTMRLFELDVPDRTNQLENHYALYNEVLKQLSLQGLEFFEPYDVAGYDPYFQVPEFQRYWISPNYLAQRYKFIELLITGSFTMGDTSLQLDMVKFVEEKCSDPSNAELLIEELVSWIFPISLDSERFDYFKNTILLDELSEMNWANEWVNYLSTNDDTNVRIQLDALALAMMQSPEYQLY